MNPAEEPRTPWIDYPRLLRIASAAENTYVGRHWPTMAAMRRDGIGSGLVEDRQNEVKIRRYLDTFQPAFMVELLREAAARADGPENPTEAARMAGWNEVISRLRFIFAHHPDELFVVNGLDARGPEWKLPGSEGRPPETRIDVERLDPVALKRAWIVLVDMHNANRWEPDRYNCAAFLKAWMDTYDRLAPTAPEPAEGTR